MYTEQKIREAIATVLAMAYERAGEAHEYIRTMMDDQLRAFYDKFVAYAAFKSGQAARVAAQHIYEGGIGELIDHRTFAKLTAEKQMAIDHLDSTMMALEQASLSSARMLTAGYRAGKHLVSPILSLPGTDDSSEVVIAALLPLLVLLGIHYMPRAMWRFMVYQCGFFVLLVMAVQFTR